MARHLVLRVVPPIRASQARKLTVTAPYGLGSEQVGQSELTQMPAEDKHTCKTEAQSQT